MLEWINEQCRMKKDDDTIGHQRGRWNEGSRTRVYSLVLYEPRRTSSLTRLARDV